MIAENHRSTVLVAAVLLMAPSLGFGSGFALFEHGNRGMAMGGAMTAVADDPSALFWNPAGMAYQTDKGVQLMIGATYIKPEQTFYGAAPFPGDGYAAEQVEQGFYPIHLYLGLPVNERLEVSFSVTNPFGLGTYWEEDFLGRFISKKADLETFDLGISMAYRISDNLAFGIGADYIYSTIELRRNAGLINPYTQRLTDVADGFLETSGSDNTAFAWNVGLLAKLGAGFQLGALYRSGFTLDYVGTGSFEQIPTGYPDFDALVGGIIPIGNEVPITTSIDSPDFWVVGLSWQNEKWTLSGQYGVMGWSSFDQLSIVFPENPLLSEVIREDYEDAAQYRFGGEFRASRRWALQLGYVFDETGQPVASMSPLLGDGDRTGYSGGISLSTRHFRVDLGYMYLEYEGRSTEGTSWVGFDGRYEGEAQLAGATFTFTF